VEIILPNQEFIDVFNNKKRFIAVSAEECTVEAGGVVDITGDNNGPTMQRIVTHVWQQDILVRGDQKMAYLSVKPLTKAERSAKGN
jgi:hypothetical protein